MTHIYHTLKLTQHETGILQITLNRPERLNALSAELLNELDQVLEHAKHNPATKAILLIGEGQKAFCAGADINQLAELNAQQGLYFAEKGQAIFRKLETLDKPSLAAINGYAFGGGCELAMSASIRIASQNAVFGQPEVKLGVIPGYGGTQRLARLIGKGRALDLCLTGRSIKADEALTWGLITEITTAENLLTRAHEILNGIVSLAPLAIRSILQVIDRGYDLPLPDALHLEAVHFGLLCATNDKHEGVSAFLQKKSANFTGE
jgi:enoyl-CoA hydratase